MRSPHLGYGSRKKGEKARQNPLFQDRNSSLSVTTGSTSLPTSSPGHQKHHGARVPLPKNDLVSVPARPPPPPPPSVKKVKLRKESQRNVMSVLKPNEGLPLTILPQSERLTLAGIPTATSCEIFQHSMFEIGYEAKKETILNEQWCVWRIEKNLFQKYEEVSHFNVLAKGVGERDNNQAKSCQRSYLLPKTEAEALAVALAAQPVEDKSRAKEREANLDDDVSTVNPLVAKVPSKEKPNAKSMKSSVFSQIKQKAKEMTDNKLQHLIDDLMHEHDDTAIDPSHSFLSTSVPSCWIKEVSNNYDVVSRVLFS